MTIASYSKIIRYREHKTNRISIKRRGVNVLKLELYIHRYTFCTVKRQSPNKKQEDKQLVFIALWVALDQAAGTIYQKFCYELYLKENIKSRSYTHMNTQIQFHLKKLANYPISNMPF